MAEPTTSINTTNKSAAVELADWINENEHLKGTDQYNLVADGLRDAVALDVEQKYVDLFAAQAPEESGAFSDFARSFGINTLEVGSGLNQLALEGAAKFKIPGAEDLLKRYTGTMSGLVRDQQSLTEDSPISSLAGDIVSDTAILLASPANRKDSAKRLYKKMVESGLELGVLEGVKLVDENGDRKDIATGSALIGALSRGAFEKLADSFNAIRGKASKEISQELDQLSKQFDTEVSVGDLTQSKAWQLTENLLDRVPYVGTGDFARRQGESLEKASQKIIDNYGIPDDEISNFLTGAVKNKYQKIKKINDQNYLKVQESFGDSVVNLRNANQEANDIINRLSPNINSPEVKTLINELETFLPKEYFGLDGAGNLINQKGLGKETKLFADAFEQRKIYSRLQFKANMSGDFLKADVYGKLGNAIQKDIDDLADNLGGDQAALYNKAKTYYAKEVAPFNTLQFKKIRKADQYPAFNPDNIYATFVKPNAKGTKNLKKLTDKIELDELQMLKQQVLSDAHLAATKKDVFEPTVFASEIKKMATARKVVFTEAENKVLDGYVKLANSLPRAKLSSDQQAANISRVAGSIPGLATISTGAGVVTGATPLVTGGLSIMGGIIGISSLLTSDVGKKLLTQAGTKEISDPFLRDLNKEILNITKTKVIPALSVPSVNIEEDFEE